MFSKRFGEIVMIKYGGIYINKLYAGVYLNKLYVGVYSPGMAFIKLNYTDIITPSLNVKFSCQYVSCASNCS